MHTIDANSELGAVSLSDGQALAATAAGTCKDVSGYQGVLKVILNSGAGGVGGTLDVKIQTGDASDGSDAADITDAAFTQVGNAASFQSIGVDTRACGKYIREYHTVAGGGSFASAIQFVGQQKYA